ncbi:cytochrome P450 2C70-like isoform X2 [Ruditapes philippinarum]|uniref:cytochrome P450 2C70-like isoform X2 n=1 Tax=Ruditapes philippinarum TaxID=129788 RepID=UPI00295AA18C|nr:cytochrome P450 2C70-like isoform X2 [Ruditapes philippinarum]
MEFELFCFVLAMFSLYILFSKRRKGNGKVLVGPKGLPILGSILEIDDENMHFKLSEYAEQYGEIFQVKLLFDDFVVLNSERVIRKCFGSDKYKHVFNDRSEMFYGKHFACNSKALSYVIDGTGQFHRTARKHVTQALHAYGCGLHDLENNVMTELSRLQTNIEETHTFECVSTILHSISNVLSLMLIGEPVLDDEKEKNMFVDEIHVEDFFLNSYVNFIMSVFPFARYIPGRYRTEFLKAKTVNAKIVKKYFHDVKTTFVRGQVRGIVDVFLEDQIQQTESGEEVFFTDDNIIAQVTDIIDAGITTTWSVLSNTMLILLNHPQYQRLLQNEIDREIGRERLPTFKDRNNCTFFKAFEMEVHRYIPVAPLMLPHKCKTDVDFEGYDISMNSTDMLRIYCVICRLPCCLSSLEHYLNTLRSCCLFLYAHFPITSRS